MAMQKLKMNSEVKKILDLRLAKGEITSEEYDALRIKLENPEPGETWNDPERRIENKQECVTINRNLEVRFDAIIYHGKTIELSEVVSLNFEMIRIETNAIPQTHTRLFISLADGNVISTKGFAVFMDGKKNKNIALAYQIIAKNTFHGRLMRVINEINKNGCFTIPSTAIKIFPNGDIVKGETRINMHEAEKDGHLLIGTYNRIFLAKSSTAPDDVIIGRGGTSIINERIAFTLKENKDIYHALLRNILYAEKRNT